MAYQPLTREELTRLINSSHPLHRRAAAEILIQRARADSPLDRPWVGILGMLGVAAMVVLLAAGALRLRPAPARPLPKEGCAAVDRQLRMAKGMLQRGRPRDVEDAMLIVGAVAPWAGECRGDPRVTNALAIGAVGGRDKALAAVTIVLRSP